MCGGLVVRAAVWWWCRRAHLVCVCEFDLTHTATFYRKQNCHTLTAKSQTQHLQRQVHERSLPVIDQLHRGRKRLEGRVKGKVRQLPRRVSLSEHTIVDPEQLLLFPLFCALEVPILALDLVKHQLEFVLGSLNRLWKGPESRHMACETCWDLEKK